MWTTFLGRSMTFDRLTTPHQSRASWVLIAIRFSKILLRPDHANLAPKRFFFGESRSLEDEGGERIVEGEKFRNEIVSFGGEPASLRFPAFAQGHGVDRSPI